MHVDKRRKRQSSLAVPHLYGILSRVQVAWPVRDLPTTAHYYWRASAKISTSLYPL